jgi:methionyl-tRNA formyltransferase
VLQPERLDAAALAALAALRPDVALVVAYGHILRDDVIAVPRLGTLNLHASLLPRTAGPRRSRPRSPPGDRETGMTLMRIVRELDAGPGRGRERVDDRPLDTASEVEAKLAAAAIPLVPGRFPSLRGASSRSGPGRRGRATAAGSSKADGVLDFSAPAQVLARASTACTRGPPSPWTRRARR